MIKTFKIGDRCKIIGDDNSHKISLGTVVTLKKVFGTRPDKTTTWSVEGHTVCVSSLCLELAEPVFASTEYSTTSPLLGLFSKERLLSQEVKLETFDFVPF